MERKRIVIIRHPSRHSGERVPASEDIVYTSSPARVRVARAKGHESHTAHTIPVVLPATKPSTRSHATHRQPATRRRRASAASSYRYRAQSFSRREIPQRVPEFTGAGSLEAPGNDGPGSIAGHSIPAKCGTFGRRCGPQSRFGEQVRPVRERHTRFDPATDRSQLAQ